MGWAWVIIFLLTSSAPGGLSVFCPAPVVYNKNRTENEVLEKIQGKTLHFANCYSRHFTNEDAVSFKVRFRFVIKPSGLVDQIEVVETGTDQKGMISCLETILMQVQFSRIPLSKGSCTVEQSIIFRF
ncbi:MAG: AgmX/PglI C-terminal domain-containing protein [Bacteroidetes bacterium]|nr:AgmX/PglI C-terminal domain-containing protein [Bacteroidota bacterium]